MFIHNWFIFIFDLVWKIIHVQNKPYIICTENTPGRVDSGRVDPGPSWLRGWLDFRPSWPATFTLYKIWFLEKASTFDLFSYGNTSLLPIVS